MALRQADRADIYMAVEAVLGTNTGQNGFAWQVEGMVGTGLPSSRVYYVQVQQFAAFPGGNHFGIVIVTLVPGIPRHSGVLYGTYYATLDAAVTATGAQILAAGNETSQVSGVLDATNTN